MFTPLHNNLLVIKIEEESKFGIPSDSLSFKAEVQSIGEDVEDISVGDIVWLSKYSGTPYKDGLIVKEYDVVWIDNGKSNNDNSRD